MIVGGGWSVCRVAEIIAQRKIFADVICVSEERLGEYSVPWLDHRICYSGFPAVNRATFCVVAGRPDGASHHLGRFGVRSRGQVELSYIRALSRTRFFVV